MTLNRYLTFAPDEAAREALRETWSTPMECPIERREADEREAREARAKEERQRRERQGRELVQVDQRIERLYCILYGVLARECSRQQAELAEAEARIIAEAKAEFAKMLAVLEAKIEGRFAAIEPRLDRLAEVRAEVSRFREELLGPRRTH